MPPTTYHREPETSIDYTIYKLTVHGEEKLHRHLTSWASGLADVLVFKNGCVCPMFFSINTLGLQGTGISTYLIGWFFHGKYVYIYICISPNAWIPIKLVFQTALEATEAEETLPGSQVKYNISILRIYLLRSFLNGR